MKSRLVVLAIAAFALAVGLPSATHAACSISTDINLSFNNLGGLAIQVCVGISTSGGNTTISLDSVSGAPASFGAFQKVFDVAWNGSSSNTFTSAGGSGLNGGTWTAQTPDNGLDGFNSFVINGAANAGTPFSVVGTTWLVSGTGITDVAMHLGWANGCTAVFFGGSQTTGVTNNTGGLTGNCTGTTTTPEPGTLFLMGSGLLGVAGLVRRKLLS